ncbi:MAG: sigma-70 family RNA polymerase sigma factor [Planctomycetota bacterium]
MSSPTTNIPLIQSLSDAGNEHAWAEFARTYEPTILSVAKGLGLNDVDARDATQEVLLHVSQVIGRWQPSGNPGAFRSWLRTVAKNQMIKILGRTNMLRSESAAFDWQAETARDADGFSNADLDVQACRQILSLAVRRIQVHFTESTWTAFAKTYIDGESCESIASQLGMSVGAVYIARSRVINRLQREVRRLIDEDGAMLDLNISDTTSVFLRSLSDAKTTDPKNSKSSEPKSREDDRG